MGPIIPALANQYRPPLPETNPNVRKGNATKKRRTVTLKRKFRPVAPKATVMTLPKPPIKPASNAAAASMSMMVRQDTPWPSTCTLSGNLFQDRNWFLPKDYLATEKKEEMAKPYPKEEDKMEEQDLKEEKCGWEPGCPLCQAQKKEADPPHQQEPMENQQQQKPLPKPQVIRPDTLSMTKTKQQWEQEMERLNEKYNLDTFSDSELDSESDEDERYQYQHGYEMLIFRRNFQRTKMSRKTKNFCNNIVFKNHFADKISKFLGNQNLQFMYDFDFKT